MIAIEVIQIGSCFWCGEHDDTNNFAELSFFQNGHQVTRMATLSNFYENWYFGEIHVANMMVQLHFF